MSASRAKGNPRGFISVTERRRAFMAAISTGEVDYIGRPERQRQSDRALDQICINPTLQHKCDPDKAKHHLKRLECKNLKVELSVADAAFANAVDAAALIRETAHQWWIDVNIVREAEDAYWDNVWRKERWCASCWSGRATADWMAD